MSVMDNDRLISNNCRNIVVIGASAGGVSALQRLAADLTPEFPAVVLIVLHVGAHPSVLPQLLEQAGPNSAAHAKDGEPLRTGHLAVAPPDYHLLLDVGRLQLVKGPKENFARPAIDPLFRSAAIAYGPRVIGVVLTGDLDDGAAGLQAIKSCGGIAVVQDPETAFSRSMPDHALLYVDVDRCVRLESLASVLLSLVQQPCPPPVEITTMLRDEHAPQTGTVNSIESLQAIGTPSSLACPECGGGLWEINQHNPSRYRCHTGHAYTVHSLEYAMKEKVEASLWSAVRALQERAALLRRLSALEKNPKKTTNETDERADSDERCAEDVRKIITRLA